jgi:hypothetical protein
MDVANEGAADAGPPCVPIDGGKPCTPGQADCFQYGACASGLVCCTAFGCISKSSESMCFNKLEGGVYECDETSDCEGGPCCYAHQSDANRLGAFCNALCVTPDVIACKQDSECAKYLQKCKIVSCFGVTIQTCNGVCPQ